MLISRGELAHLKAKSPFETYFSLFTIVRKKDQR